MDTLLENVVANPQDKAARRELQNLLGLDDTNFEAYLILYNAFKNPKDTQRIEIFEPGKNSADAAIAYPTAIAPKDVLAKLPYVEYRTLQKESARYKAAASKSTLWVKKMQAGTGSNVIRTSYLAEIRGVPSEEIKLGAKGTDLYVTLPGQDSGKAALLSIAELQILQQLIEKQLGDFAEIVFHDLVSTETSASLDAIWNKASFLNSKQTYRQSAGAEVKRFVQAQVYSIDKTTGRISKNRKAPTGHWIFAVDALMAAVRDDMRPRTHGSPLVSAIGNGEDLSSTPDPLMVGWMVENKIPIAMVTTERTSIDLKGGMIALVRDREGQDYATIVEQAQAEQADQLKLFQQIGFSLKNEGQTAFFNTNMALFNYDVLVPKLTAVVSEIGEKAFLDILAPDLIKNEKKQKDADGVVRAYLQIEGAMGSTLLNLDRFWRKTYGEPLVHFINVDKENRTRFFSPVKTAFDYFMQFHSDRFALDPKTMKIENRTPGHLPQVTLKDTATEDKFYADVSNVLKTFKDTGIRQLNFLKVDGQVSLRGLRLIGRIEIVNETGSLVDLAELSRTGSLPKNGVLHDAKVVINSRGQPSITPLNP